MSSLASWLASLEPAELAAVLTRRASVQADPVHTLSGFASLALQPWAVERELETLTLPQYQLLAAATWHAHDATTDPHSPESRCELGPLLASIGAAEPGPRRDQALACLATLRTAALLWPVVGSGSAEGTGAGETLGLPAVLAQRLHASAVGPLDRTLTRVYNKGPIDVIAQALGLGWTESATRAVLQAAIVAHLTDGDTLRRVLADTPPAAAQLLTRVLRGGGELATTIFLNDRPWQPKVELAATYPDPATVWLAQHGLIVPAGPGRGAVPMEVLGLLRDGQFLEFDPEPMSLATHPVAAKRVEGEAQVALTSALLTLTTLLDLLDRQPVTPRKAGGWPVRETKRLAKALRLPDSDAIFWIGLAEAAGLIGKSRESRFDSCPTTLSDAWRGWTAPRRLAHVITAWLGLEDILTWWPLDGERPAGLQEVGFSFAPSLRRGLLATLHRLGPDEAAAYATPYVTDTAVPDEAGAQALAVLAAATYWHAPAEVSNAPNLSEAVLYTLYEAELLGLSALGGLTSLGRALPVGAPALPAGDALATAIAALLPPEQTTARFQADMTVVVAGSPTPGLSALLDSVAERESQGHALVYRVSPALVRRTIEAGADADELLDRLKAVAEGGLPQPLEYLLRDAARDHGQVRVAPVGCVLRVKDEVVLSELLSTKGLGLRRLADSILASPRPAAETLALLRASGWSPILEDETGAAVIDRPRGRRSVVKQRPAPRPIDQLKVATRLLAPPSPR